MEKLIHQVIRGGGSCGISACPSVGEDGERFPAEDRGPLVFPPFYPPCPASPLTAHLLTAITPLLPLLHHAIFHSIHHLYYISHTHTLSTSPRSLPFLHFSWEAALDSQMSLACQKLLLTFQFSVFFSSRCSLLMPYSRRTFTCQWARQKKRGRVCPLPCP